MTAASSQAIVLAFSLACALFIALIPLITVFYKATMSATVRGLLLFVALPIVSWGLTAMFNVFIQLIQCGTVNAGQVLLNGLPTIGLVSIFGLAAYFISFLRSPVEAIMPISMPEEVRKGVAVAFFIFWGGLYGQAVGGSFSQSC